MVGVEVMGWVSSTWVGAISPWSSSCSPGGREFVHEFGRSAEKGV